jgi:superoxide dismutase, Cu-Zn family
MEYWYKKKYDKYKSKYLNLKNNYIGGSGNQNLNSNIKQIKAIAFFSNSSIKGTVKFQETIDNLVLVDVNLEGFEPNTVHGFHVHESGDLTSGCDSMCAHFNPYNQTHGGRNDSIRHVGDLGNLEADSEGKVIIQFIDNMIKLRGDEANIIGRGLIVHADPDDCGKGLFPDSKTTGHSGKRIACAIIGIAQNC